MAIDTGIAIDACFTVASSFGTGYRLNIDELGIIFYLDEVFI